MIKKGYREVLKVASEPLRDGMIVDYDLLDVICARLHKYPERNPLRAREVQDLVGLAINTWDEASIGVDPDTYLANLLAQHLKVRQMLVDKGYYSDVEVAVEPDPADDTSEAPVEALGHS